MLDNCQKYVSAHWHYVDKFAAFFMLVGSVHVLALCDTSG